MGTRLGLQLLLESVLGSSNVYYDPPESVKMNYPCIVYSLSKIQTDFANNKPYSHKKRYTMTVIDKNPDSSVPDQVAALAQCIHETHFASKNLHHYVYNIVF
jgi:hypothetical protein